MEDDAWEFNPERWLVPGEDGKSPYFNAKAGFAAPFGPGIRSCAGKSLAVSGLTGPCYPDRLTLEAARTEDLHRDLELGILL